MQIAFVPEDFDAAITYWTEVMGVGPFFLIENIQLPDSRYLGEPNHCNFSIALAYWGDVQIELIRQENDAPSIYRGAKGQSGCGVLCFQRRAHFVDSRSRNGGWPLGVFDWPLYAAHHGRCQGGWFVARGDLY